VYTAKNLFIDLHETTYGTTERRFGRGWENLFTDQYAFFLSADLPSATTVARTLFPGLEASVHRVETQVVSDVGIPDFCFELTTGKRLYVEHKFDARLNETQLQRYVALGRVALISRTNQSIPKDVLDSPNYSHPTDPLHVHDTRHTFASRLLRCHSKFELTAFSKFKLSACPGLESHLHGREGTLADASGTRA
jgi:hypothetical protein